MFSSKAADGRMFLKDALQVVFKRKRLILIAFLIVATGISLAIMSVPTSYDVSGKLVVTRSRGDVLVSPADSRNFNFGLTSPTMQDMAVHAELLKNRSLITAVAKKLNLDAPKKEEASSASIVPANFNLPQAVAWIPEKVTGWLPWSTPPPADPNAPLPPGTRSRLDTAADLITAAMTVQV